MLKVLGGMICGDKENVLKNAVGMNMIESKLSRFAAWTGERNVIRRWKQENQSVKITHRFRAINRILFNCQSVEYVADYFPKARCP